MPNFRHPGLLLLIAKKAYIKACVCGGIVFPNASKAEYTIFPPKSLGDSFVAVFCGFDTNDRRHALFESVSAESFKKQAKALQQENPVYASHHFDEKAVDEWPKDGSPPKILLECCVQLPDEQEQLLRVPSRQYTGKHGEPPRNYIYLLYVSTYGIISP